MTVVTVVVVAVVVSVAHFEQNNICSRKNDVVGAVAVAVANAANAANVADVADVADVGQQHLQCKAVKTNSSSRNIFVVDVVGGVAFASANAN